MDMLVNKHCSNPSTRTDGIRSLRLQLRTLRNLPNCLRLATIEQLFAEAGGANPGTTRSLFGSHHGPAQITIDADTINRQCAEMDQIAGYHREEGRQSALAAIRCTLERMIVALRHIDYPGLTNTLPATI